MKERDKKEGWFEIKNHKKSLIIKRQIIKEKKKDNTVRVLSLLFPIYIYYNYKVILSILSKVLSNY